MKKNAEYFTLAGLYFPFQLLLMAVLTPVAIVGFAWIRAKDIAFEDVYFTSDNPMVNPDGPTMRKKKEHCWLVRFINPWL
jgi:hypothetical protein